MNELELLPKIDLDAVELYVVTRLLASDEFIGKDIREDHIVADRFWRVFLDTIIQDLKLRYKNDQARIQYIQAALKVFSTKQGGKLYTRELAVNLHRRIRRQIENDFAGEASPEKSIVEG